MTKDQKIDVLKKAFEDVVWMAIRYADGRHTYAPSMVRDAIDSFQGVFPDWSPSDDITISEPDEQELGGVSFRGDYLYDILNKEN